MAKVLVIEDDENVRSFLCRALRTAGHVAIEADQGAKGMEALRRDGPDLVVTDMLMPGQDGIETIAKIRELSGLPIIAISGQRQQGGFAPLLDAELMGADITLAKPFTVEALLSAVSELLTGDEERRATER